MKKIIITSLAILSIAAAPTPSFTFLRYSESGNNSTGNIIGVTLNRGVKEIHNADGSKSYYICSKTLKEVVEAYNQ